MLDQVQVSQQITQMHGDPLRVLVVGAGVAGMSIAQLLRRRGLHPVLIERSAAAADAGYMLGLMPMVDPVVEALGVGDIYLNRSVEFRRYRSHAHTGRRLREDDLAGLLSAYGHYRGITRGDLLRALATGDSPVAYQTTAVAMTSSSDRVVVTLASGSERLEAEFDLVVVADGLHSTTRGLIPALASPSIYDTRWGGWVVWMDPDTETDLGEELWGAGFFVGSYPVKDRLGVFVGGPRVDTSAGPQRFVAEIRARHLSIGDRTDRALAAVSEDDDPYYWSLTDCRSHTWHDGRVVLLGDAAAGFLPTAGIGAGMAMESAWVLADHLTGTEPASIPPALAAYEAAQRPRVEAAQRNSRWLARLVMRRSRALATVRDLALSRVSVDAVLGPIKKLLADPPIVTPAEPSSTPTRVSRP